MWKSSTTHLKFEKDTSPTEPTGCEDDEDLSWLDQLPCPEAPASPVELDKKRASENSQENSQLEDRPLKVMRFDTDEMELLDPSTGDDAAADYELVNGRFVKINNSFRFTSANDPIYTPTNASQTNVSTYRNKFDKLLLTKGEWEVVQDNHHSRVLGANWW
jgi:hypothetical protein